jgi:hypothetical protein
MEEVAAEIAQNNQEYKKGRIIFAENMMRIFPVRMVATGIIVIANFLLCVASLLRKSNNQWCDAALTIVVVCSLLMAISWWL